MKTKTGNQMLDPNHLFRIESGEVPPHVRTVSDFRKWRTAEDQAMLDEAARLFRIELDRAFQQFERDLSDATQH